MAHPQPTGSRYRGWLVQTPRRLQLAVFLAIGVITLLGVFGIENAETHRRHARLERDAADIAAAWRQLDTEHEIYLRASAALLATQPQITLAICQQLQNQLNFKTYRQGSLGVAWAPRIAASQVAKADAAFQARSPLPFHIRRLPGSSGRDAYPVAFIDPPNQRNAVALGFDMYSEPTRRAAMDQAAASNSPVATGRVQLAQDGADGLPHPAAPAAFLMYMPVFGLGQNRLANAATSGHGPLRGFVYMPFRATTLLAIASRLAAGDHIGVAAYDGAMAPDRLMAATGMSQAALARIDGPKRADARGVLVETVTIAGRPWQLVVSNEQPDGLSVLSQITILSGLVVAVLLTILIHMTYRNLAEERAWLEWKASEAGIRNSLTRELNHRVKNTLATVLSIVTLTRRRETDLDSYVDNLSGRIRALSATHDLLTSSDWSSIELRQIILAELAPYLGGHDDRVSVSGPEIRLAPSDALTSGLAVHELATNAAKYGALSVLTGRIDICWVKLTEAAVEIHWQETGGPVVSEPSKRGFGRDLIEKILARELDSPVKLDFAPGGLQCIFRVPLRQSIPFVLRTEPRPSETMAF